MKYQITITEIDDDNATETVRYQQTIDDHIDMQAIISAVNATPLGARQRLRALRSDAGKPRRKEPVQTEPFDEESAEVNE